MHKEDHIHAAQALAEAAAASMLSRDNATAAMGIALADSAFAFACNSYNMNTVGAGCTIDYLAPGREGDVLTAHAVEQALAGKSGVYDVKVSNQEGRAIALFRGKSIRVAGEVISN